MRARPRPDDQPGTDHYRARPREGRGAWRVRRHAEPAEAVEQHGGEHLPRDEQTDGDQSAEAREQQDAGSDVNRTADASGQRPRFGLVEQLERAERASQRRQRQEQQRSDSQLQRRGAERTSHRRRKLNVGGTLQRQ
jgi:hypothetical protein